jgi:uncharacterized protein (TIGR04255 family)
MRWLPAHTDHAIETVTVTLQFQEQIPQKPWSAMLARASVGMPAAGFNVMTDEAEVSLGPTPLSGLPGAGVIQGMVFGPGGALFGPAPPGLTQQIGRAFRHVADNDVREQVTLHRNRFLYSTKNYSGWTVLRNRIEELLGSFTQEAVRSTDLKLVKLEYWDRFRWSEQGEPANYRDLLRADSRHLPRFPFESNELWHSHIGYFEPPGLNLRRLINVNVDVMDLREALSGKDEPAERRSVGIYSMAQDEFLGETSVDANGGTFSTLNDLHDKLGTVLLDIITDEAAQRIHLMKRSMI